MAMLEEFGNPDEEEIVVRLASVGDAPSLAKLRYAFRSNTGIGPASEDEAGFIERCNVWMQERLREDGPWRCWIAEQERALVGNLWGQLIEKIPNPSPEPEYHAYLTNFYVSEGARGRGVGSRLLSAALDWCRASQVHAVILWPTERSRPLYLRHGFAVREDLLELLIAEKSEEH